MARSMKHLTFHRGSVATHLRCGGIVSDSIITNFLLILTMKQLLKWLIFHAVKAYEKLCQFLGHPVYEFITAVDIVLINVRDVCDQNK